MVKMEHVPIRYVNWITELETILGLNSECHLYSQLQMLGNIEKNIYIYVNKNKQIQKKKSQGMMKHTKSG